jgi:hypothetical protein
MNAFAKPTTEYHRDINILQHCHDDNAFYLHKVTGKPFDECLAWVIKETSTGGKFPIVDPDVLALCRDKGEDKERQVMKLSNYISDVIEKEYIVAPSMAVYVSTKENESLIAKFIAINIAARAKAKKEMFEADLAGNKLLKAFKNIEQTSRKLNNNALSGAQASYSTPLYNKSAHSALTSTCRTETSYGNAVNEKFIAGNRHLWCPDVVISSIITISRMTDLLGLNAIMHKYHLHFPTAEEAMQVVLYSTKFYWQNKDSESEIFELLSCLSPIERAAFVYVGDLYHLHVYNPSIVVDFLVRISSKHVATPDMNHDEIMSHVDSDLNAYVCSLCWRELIGTSIRDLKKSDPEKFLTVVGTVNNILNTIDDFSDIIKVLWVSENLPSSVASIPSIIRRAAVLSDTDSTVFTAQHWTHTVTGSYKFTDLSKAVSATITYLSTQIIAHVLAIMSANIGVDPKHIAKLGMKNEYNFPVLALTSRAKHYYAYKGSQEGNVKKEYEMEVKGVELRSSNIPAHVMFVLHKLIAFIMDEVIANGDLSIVDIFDEIALLELDIINSVNAGGYSYMSTGQIKEIESYKKPHSSNYIYYGLWEEVFADKYGHTAPPSFSVVKVSLNANNPAKFKAWLDGFGDQLLADKFRAWAAKTGKKNMTQILLPENVVSATGIPPEIIKGVNTRKLVYGTVSGFYLILESLGIYMIDNNLTRLVSDFHVPTRTKSRFENIPEARAVSSEGNDEEETEE